MSPATAISPSVQTVALVPATPWLGSTPPAAPLLRQRWRGDLLIAPTEGTRDAFLYALWRRSGTRWHFALQPAHDLAHIILRFAVGRYPAIFQDSAWSCIVSRQGKRNIIAKTFKLLTQIGSPARNILFHIMRVANTQLPRSAWHQLHYTHCASRGNGARIIS